MARRRPSTRHGHFPWQETCTWWKIYTERLQPVSGPSLVRQAVHSALEGIAQGMEQPCSA
jgi:hypothetical protein